MASQMCKHPIYVYIVSAICTTMNMTQYTMRLKILSNMSQVSCCTTSLVGIVNAVERKNTFTYVLSLKAFQKLPFSKTNI